MQSPQLKIFSMVVLTAFLLMLPIPANAQPFPDYLQTQYRPYFRQFVDGRSLPERMLNGTGLTSQDDGRGFALIAGVSKYPKMRGQASDLAAAAEDVRKLVEYLRVYEKFDEIVVLENAAVTQSNLSFFWNGIFRAAYGSSRNHGSCSPTAGMALTNMKMAIY